jgi:hypothetical protein
MPLRSREALVAICWSRWDVGSRQPQPALPCLVPDVRRGLPQPHVQIHDGRHGLVGAGEGVQPNCAERTDDLGPVQWDDLAKRVRVKRLLGRVQDRILGQHLAKLPHPTVEQAAAELAGQHLQGCLAGRALAMRELPGIRKPGGPEANHSHGIGWERRGIAQVIFGAARGVTLLAALGFPDRHHHPPF